MSLSTPVRRACTASLLFCLAGCSAPLASAPPVHGAYPIAIRAVATSTDVAIQGRTAPDAPSRIFLLDTVTLTVSPIPDVTDSPGDNTHPRLSPNGRYLAWQSTDERGNADIRFTCLNPPSGINIGPDSLAQETQPVIDNLGRIVYVYDNGREAQLRRYDSGRNVRFARVAFRVLDDLSVSGDGTSVAFTGGRTADAQRVQLLNTTTGALSALPDALPSSCHAPCLSGDGKRLLLLDRVEGRDKLFEFDLSSRSLSPLWPDFSGELQAPRYVGSGTTRLVLQRAGETASELFSAPRSARAPQSLASELSSAALRTP